MDDTTVIMAVDPGLTCTAWSAMKPPDRDNLHGKLFGSGHISSPQKAPLYRRCQFIVDRLADIATHIQPDLLVVEFPMLKARGKSRQRSASSLPGYGVIVGAIAFGIMPQHQVWGVSASTWTKDAPTVGADPYKTDRVLQVQALYGLDRDSLGAKSIAGNIADAILINKWAHKTANYNRKVSVMNDAPLGFGSKTEDQPPKKKYRKAEAPPKYPPPTIDAEAAKAIKAIKADELRAEIETLEAKLAVCLRQLRVYES